MSELCVSQFGSALSAQIAQKLAEPFGCAPLGIRMGRCEFGASPAPEGSEGSEGSEGHGPMDLHDKKNFIRQNLIKISLKVIKCHQL